MKNIFPENSFAKVKIKTRYRPPFLIYFKTCSTKNWNYKKRLLVIFTSLLMMQILISPTLAKAQNIQLNYKVAKGDDDIGWLSLSKNIAGNRLSLILNSEIKFRLLFLFTVSAKETSVFENGVLMSSSQFRKTNGDTKIDTQTKLLGSQYQVLENGEKKILPFATIGINLLSLYFQEPLNNESVYCDNHQCYSPIIKTSDGGYKVKFPDGNSNSYYYRDGICIKIKIDHTFYSAVVTLIP